MATAPKVTFGNKSTTANFATNPQFSSSVNAGNQNLVTNFNPSGNYQYAANQVVSGQPAQYSAASPLYEYRSNQPEIRIGSGDFNQYRNTGAPVTTIPQTTVVRQTRLNEEIQRPQYSKVNQNGQPSKKLAPDTDPRPETPICSPWWWILGGLIALALLTLALLFGLGVIGGSRNGNSSPPVTAAAGSPSNAGAGASAGGNSGASGKSGSSGTSSASGSSSTSGSSVASGTSGSSGTSSASGSSVASGTSSAGGSPIASGTSGSSGTSSTSSPSNQAGISTINNGKTSSGASSNSGSPSSSTNSGVPSGSSAQNPQNISSVQGSSGTSANNGGSSSNGVNGVTGISPIPYNPTSPSPSQAAPNTKPAVVQPASIQPATVAPVVVTPVSLQVKVVNSTSPTVSTPSSTKI